MGRKALHTQEEVFKVADELAAKGIEVTPTVLHTALGGGSMTTIYKHLPVWIEQRKQAAAPVPVAMPDAVLASFNQTWQVAAQEAAKEVAAIREKADAEVKEMRRNADEAVETIVRLEAEAEADAVKLEMLERELSDTKRAANAATTEAAKQVSALAATVEQMQNQIAEQHAAILRGHDEHQVFRQDKADEMGRLTADFMNRLAEQADALRLANADLSSLRGKLDDATGQLAIARSDATTARAEHAEASAKALDLTKQLAAAREEATAAAKQTEQALTITRQQLAEASATALDLTGQLGNLTGQCDALRAQVHSQETIIKGFAGGKPAADGGTVTTGKAKK